MEPTDLIETIKERQRQSDSLLTSWRKEARENYDMVAGDGRQWTAADRAKLEGEERPCVEFNRLGTIIDAVSGSEVNNRQEVTFIPRVLGDVQKTGVASLRTSAAKWVRDNCDAEDEESDAFVDVLITGVGWTQTRMDYEEEEEGKIVTERRDPLCMRWDARARKRNLADARWVEYRDRLPLDEVKAKWPEKAEDIEASPEGSTTEDDEEDPKVVDPKTAYDGSGDESVDDSCVEVIHHQWYEVDYIYKVLSPTGEMVDVPEDRFPMVQTLFPSIKYARIPRRRYMEAFVCGNIELQVGPAPCQHGFTYQAITGKRDRNKGYWYGLVRPGKDPQRWANKFFSQILHIVNTNAKGGIMYETGAVSNTRKLERDWAKADSAIQLNSGGLQKITPKPLSPIPPALPELMEFSISSIRDGTGVNLELLGMVDRQQAGVLEAQRTRAGLTILAPFFDSLRLYRKRQGRVLAYFINEYIADGRLIRISSPGGEQFVPLMKQGDVDYETVVDAAPTARDTKEQAWGALQQIIPGFMKMGVPLPPEVMDFMPIPETLAQAMKKAYMAHMAQQQQPNPMMQAELANKNADTEQKEAAAAKSYMDATATGIQFLAALMGPGMGMMSQPQPGMQPPSTVQ